MNRSWWNSRTEIHYKLFYYFERFIFVFSVIQKLFPVVALWHILFSTCIVELSEKSTWFLSCHILNTVYLFRVINKPQQFYSYRAIWEYTSSRVWDISVISRNAWQSTWRVFWLFFWCTSNPKRLFFFIVLRKLFR